MIFSLIAMMDKRQKIDEKDGCNDKHLIVAVAK